MSVFPRRAPLADAVALVVFATIGLLAHHKGISATGYARGALPLLAGWLAAGLVLGLYGRPSATRLVATWLVGISLGVGIRALALGVLDGEQATFLGVALAFTLFFVVVGRLALSLVPDQARAERCRWRR